MMDMKKAGIVLLVIGLVITLYTGFHYVTRETIVDLGDVEIKANKRHHLEWSPIIGVVVMAVGAGAYLMGGKK
jgi:hypothetical protein